MKNTHFNKTVLLSKKQTLTRRKPCQTFLCNTFKQGIILYSIKMLVFNSVLLLRK